MKMPPEIIDLFTCGRLRIAWLQNKITGERIPYPTAETQWIDCTGSIREYCANLALEMDSHVWAEFGVENGTSATYFFSKLPATGQLHLFDSFKGNPEPWLGQPVGSHKAEVIPKFDSSRVHIYEGWFEDTLPVDQTFDFVHIDCDLYSSTKTVLDNINVKSGTIILFDEFHGYKGWQEGEYKALMEWEQQWEYIARDDDYRVAIQVL